MLDKFLKIVGALAVAHFVIMHTDLPMRVLDIIGYH